MNIVKVLIQELFRSIAIGYVAFAILAPLLYPIGRIRRKATFIATGILMLVMFMVLSIVRIRTGSELMVRGALGWSIAAASMYAFALAIVSVGVVLGQSAILFLHGFWSVAAWVIPPGIIAWAGYHFSEKLPPQN